MQNCNEKFCFTVTSTSFSNFIDPNGTAFKTASPTLNGNEETFKIACDELNKIRKKDYLKFGK